MPLPPHKEVKFPREMGEFMSRRVMHLLHPELTSSQTLQKLLESAYGQGLIDVMDVLGSKGHDVDALLVEVSKKP